MTRLLVILILASGAAGAASATKPARPTDATFQSCITADCHADKKTFAVVHAPVVSNTCDACHELTSAKEHTFKPIRDKADMCTYCHEFDVSAMPVIHKPVTTGECLGCHDPHGGNSRGILRENSITQLCGRCHESVTHRKAAVHTPVARGECDSCHPPHASRFPKLVDAQGADLCLACHTKLQKTMAAQKFTHKALEKGCDKCHDVHASNQPNGLTRGGADLCLDCHEKTKSQIASATVKHSVATEDVACLTCHTPHASNYAKLAADLPSRICLTCHGKKIPGVDVKIVPDVSDPKLIKHGPIRDGQCAGCHDPHGGTRENLITKNYSEKFYAIFQSQQYALCFSCHDLKLTTEQQTDTATAFRNGTKNLHALHVTQGDKGRGCSVCHGVHTAANDRLVRDAMRLGKRDIPINFHRTRTGGTCLSGCHVPYAYDREHAVPVTTQPATRPAAAIARAEIEPPQPIRWSGTDINGAPVAMPASDRPTIFMFLRAGQVENAQVPQLVSATIQGLTPSPQVIIAVTGNRAVAEALSVRASTPPSWTILADPGFTLAGQLNIWGWPTTLLIRPDGMPIARIGGSPEALPLRLSAYLSPRSPSATQPSIDPDREVSRLARLANRMIEQEKPDPAERLARDALRTFPNHPVLLLVRAKALWKLNQPFDALNQLDRIQGGALPGAQKELLKAAILFEQQRTVEAKALLATLDVPEAHRQLARIYEAEQNWQAAALEYRKASEMK